MDSNNNAAEMLDSQCGVEASCLVRQGNWEVYELQLTLPKMKWIWDEMCKYRTLFSDFTRGDPDNFYSLIVSKDTLWLEVRDLSGMMVGIVYWTGLSHMLDAEVHLIFFDRKPAEKVELCKEIAKWYFHTWPGSNRMTAVLPTIYHATIRLAEHIGFKREGKKRQSQLMGGKLVDEVILGLLAEEL